MPMSRCCGNMLGVAAAIIGACAPSDGKRAASEGRSAAPESARVSQPVNPDQPGQSTAAGLQRATSVQGAEIVVNGQVLSEQTVHQLQQVYPVTIPAGRYWYDAVSGAWGREGEPIAGQMVAGLTLGGPLAATASRGTSAVFINGRQITMGEKSYIEVLCQTPVIPGRYWIAANGIGGYEGGPAVFNLAQCPGVPQPSRAGSSSSRTYCDPNGACTTSGILGTITTAPE
jgi:hypothetical protein